MKRAMLGCQDFLGQLDSEVIGVVLVPRVFLAKRARKGSQLLVREEEIVYQESMVDLDRREKEDTRGTGGLLAMRLRVHQDLLENQDQEAKRDLMDYLEFQENKDFQA